MSLTRSAGLSRTEELELLLLLERSRIMWEPQEGPQLSAYESDADELLYGGAAGGGKSDLILGLAHKQHDKTIIFRREFPQLQGMMDRGEELFGPLGAKFNGQNKFWRFKNGKKIELGAVQRETDVRKYMGRPHDLIAFDEAAHFSELQVKFLTGWNRSAKPGQRCRVILASNPPTSAEGLWLTKRYAAWLDPKHPRPAKPGDLRWYITNERGDDEEVPGPEPVTREVKGEIKEFRPKSRTFIPARLSDNAYLRDTDYWATLQALPEPLRSQMLYGDFTAGSDDDRWQVIPTEWVREAQARWHRTERPDNHISRVGVDVARGGRDKTIITINRANWFDQLTYPGTETPDGLSVVQILIKEKLNHAPLQVDIIGVGAAVVDVAKMHQMPVTAMNASEKSEATDKTGLLKFVNKRAEWWWQLREALDPVTGSRLALPDSVDLLADLTAPRWELTVRGIQIESKDDVKKRLGRSPDFADSLTYAHAQSSTSRAIEVWSRL